VGERERLVTTRVATRPGPIRMTSARCHCFVTFCVHDDVMLFTGTESHVGYVAGRYRDGSFSDSWTDVTRCAERTFTAYAPACDCGWRGRKFPATSAGHLDCRRALVHEHLQKSARPAVSLFPLPAF
jgi:hypothetical protein